MADLYQDKLIFSQDYFQLGPGNRFYLSYDLLIKDNKSLLEEYLGKQTRDNSFLLEAKPDPKFKDSKYDPTINITSPKNPELLDIINSSDENRQIYTDAHLKKVAFFIEYNIPKSFYSFVISSPDGKKKNQEYKFQKQHFYQEVLNSNINILKSYIKSKIRQQKRKK